MQEEVENRTLTLVVSSSKFTGRLLKDAIAKYMAHRKEKKLERQRSRDAPVVPHGKQTMKQLIGQNQGVSNIEITDPSIKEFEKIARKYGVDYAVKKDRSSSPPKYLIFFKARDADALTAAFPAQCGFLLLRNCGNRRVRHCFRELCCIRRCYSGCGGCLCRKGKGSAELNQALYDKADAEMKKFTDWLLTQPPEEILRHAYVYSVKQDILLGLDSADLTKEQANALLQSPTPLEDIYKALDKWDVNMMADIQECIEGRADAVIAEMRLQYDVPLYLHPASYAQEHFELGQYRASNKANAACKEAIEAAIREHYHDNRLDSQAAEQVISTFGLERTLYVLANTVQQKNWDKRFSPGNRQWAETISITKNPDAWGNDQNSQFVVDSHSGLTDLFLRTVRREYCQEQEKSPKQSVRAKLQTQPVTT